MRGAHVSRLPTAAALLTFAALVTPGPGVAAEHAPVSPSIVLLVLDTVRADAVSAYGQIEGTTPRLDALAKAGVRYDRAYAPFSWTLPSQATLFTGLGVDSHRAGMPGQAVMPPDVTRPPV